MAWVALCAVLFFRASQQAGAGRRAAEGARLQVAQDIGAPEPVLGLRKAESSFRAAAASGCGPVTSPSRLIPVVGRQVRSFCALAQAAQDVAGISATTLAAAQSELRSARDAGERVVLLRRLGDIAARAGQALSEVDFGPRAALAGPLSRARLRLDLEVGELRSTLEKVALGVRAAADVLAGPRRVLVLAANNAEMRAGSGMFLAVAALQLDGGSLSLPEFRPSEEVSLPPGAVALDGDLAARWGWLVPNQEWRNLGVSPRFDVTAALAARMWEAATGDPVDAVLAVDPVALAAIVEATGPVEVDGRRLGSADLVDHILHGQYVASAGDPDQEARREGLGRVARAVISAVEERGWDPGRLARSMAAAARGRHILAWSARPSEQAGWVAAGVDGALGPDSLLVAVLNRGGNKLDRFLSVTATLDFDRGPERTAAALRLELRNDVPRGEPPYVAGPNPHSGVGEGVYLGILAVSLPGDARQARVDGEERLAVAGGDGPTRVVASVIQLARGETRTVVVRFELPVQRTSVQVEPSARLPAIRWTSGRETWEDSSGHHVEW